jgi:putative membrane protein
MASGSSRTSSRACSACCSRSRWSILGLATPIGSTLIGLVFLAVLSIGEDLTDPFANSVHDVPLTAMCRTIEIDLLQTAGLPAPEPLTPDHGVLW